MDITAQLIGHVAAIKAIAILLPVFTAARAYLPNLSKIVAASCLKCRSNLPKQ
jgi:hypothetical protein